MRSRVVSGSSSSVVVLIYRPGSEAVTSAFFDDLSEMFDRVAGYCDPVYIVGDLNVRLDRTDDASSQQLTELFEVYGFDRWRWWSDRPASQGPPSPK